MKISNEHCQNLIDYANMGRLVLGTAQFGMDYGIANHKGKPIVDEVKTILQYAKKIGIKVLDTASAYGNAEEILGQVLSDGHQKMSVISKLPGTKGEKMYDLDMVDKHLNETLQKTKQECLYGYMLHDVQDLFKVPQLWGKLKENKKTGKVQRIGYSLYSPWQLKKALEMGCIPDIVQVPYSLFDRRFDNCFEHLKDNGVEIHTRSMFLQGLMFLDESEISGNLIAVKDKVFKLKEISKEVGLSVSFLCMAFVLNNNNIDKVVFGVDSLTQLEENTTYLRTNTMPPSVFDKLSLLEIEDENILIPMNWSR